MFGHLYVLLSFSKSRHVERFGLRSKDPVVVPPHSFSVVDDKHRGFCDRNLPFWGLCPLHILLGVSSAPVSSVPRGHGYFICWYHAGPCRFVNRCVQLQPQDISRIFNAVVPASSDLR